jgi:Tol biopolymer transport system component
MMNADGSGQHVVYASCLNAAESWQPAFSPDGTKIVAHVAREVDSTYHDGIAIMNSDGTNLIQLTDTDPSCLGWDEMPTFTNDGKRIAFSRFCFTQDLTGLTEELYVMNVDGTNLTKLYGDGTLSRVHCQPRAVGDRLVFSSNLNALVNTDQFDLYSIKSDGSAFKRLTDNTVYDGLSVVWMNYPASTAAKMRIQKAQELKQGRLFHPRMRIAPMSER